MIEVNDSDPAIRAFTAGPTPAVFFFSSVSQSDYRHKVPVALCANILYLSSECNNFLCQLCNLISIFTHSTDCVNISISAQIVIFGTFANIGNEVYSPS